MVSIWQTISGGYYSTPVLNFVNAYVSGIDSDWALIQSNSGEWKLILGRASDQLHYTSGTVYTIFDFSGNSYKLTDETAFDEYEIRNPNDFIFYGSQIADSSLQRYDDHIEVAPLLILGICVLSLIFWRLGEKR